MDNTPKCAHCGQNQAWHTSEHTHHKFSEDGSTLEPLITNKEQLSEARRPIPYQVALGRLLGVLTKKGILTEQELARIMYGDD